MKRRFIAFVAMAVSSCVSVHPNANDPPATPRCREDTFALAAQTLYVENDTFPAPVDEHAADELAWSEMQKVVRVRSRGERVAFVQVGVAASGDVACVSLDGSSGDRRVDNAALRAASRIAWKPAIREDKASDGFVNIAVRGYKRDDDACARDFAWACHAAGHALMTAMPTTTHTAPTTTTTTSATRDLVGAGPAPPAASTGNPALHDEALALFEKACALGDIRACTDVGKERNDHALLDRSCTKGDADACVALAKLTHDDDARRNALLEKACNANDAGGCRLLALDVTTRGDDVRALALFELACARRDVEACALAGARLREGRGASVDVTRADLLEARARRRGWHQGL